MLSPEPRRTPSLPNPPTENRAPVLASGMLFTTPDLGNYISGAILYEETLFQNHADGTPFVDCLKKIGVIPGIKVDTGLSPLPGGHEVETWCSGLDGLVERAKKYYAQGARFAKWRAVLQITSDGAPSNLSIQVSQSVGCEGGWTATVAVVVCPRLRFDSGLDFVYPFFLFLVARFFFTRVARLRRVLALEEVNLLQFLHM